MRVSHIIQDNKTSRYPSDFIFFDTETTPKVNDRGDIEQPFKLGVALYWRHRADREADTKVYFNFTTIAEFWDFVVAHTLPKRPLILIAHNLQFDFMVLGGFSFLRLKGFNLTKLITSGTTNIFNYRRDKETIVCLDNMNYFPVSIKALGKECGIPKLIMPKLGGTLAEWFTYCQRDVDVMQIAWEYWLSFLRENDLGTFGKTITSQTFNAYRHRFMPAQICVKVNARATDLERRSYRGGRVECFRLGQLPRRDYYLLDINSMYPYVMKEFEYPVELRYCKTEPSIEFVTRALQTKAVIADVTVSVDQPIFGLRYDNRLIFPIGTYRVTLCSSELRRAIAQGAVVKIWAISVYSRAKIFGDFVDYFYQQRQAFKADGKPVYSYICKKMLNHLYGKFGQRNEDWEFVRTEPELVDYVEFEIDAQTGRRYLVRCIAGQVMETKGMHEGYNSFAAISAEVTANARMMLWDLMDKAGRENVYYTDTDCLLVNKTGRDRLAGELDQLELGKMKLERKTRYVTLRNVKDYKMGRVTKIKGISKTAKKIADGEFITYQQQGVRAAMRAGNVNTMTWKRVPKRLQRQYQKAVIKYGKHVYPLIMREYDGENTLDVDAMLDHYGADAMYRGQWLDDLTRMVTTTDGPKLNYDDDRPAADGYQKIIENLDARRRGEMLYQQGRER